ncbi:MAG: Bipolar DNA helicase [Ignavibacteria bacterium]|nr:MAG: Bipolar DNA helicase [Ignavibacteria bacterium]KAF0155153.1 MAG: Bipolar DNA helicase [Ignavibacteria bacterium]
MSDQNSTLIGRVKSITGSKVSIQLDSKIKSIMPIVDGVLYRVGQIGSFIKISLGYTKLYGIVNQIGADALPESLRELVMNENNDARFTTRWISAVLIGETFIDKFERGVTQFPNVEDEVHIVTLEDLNLIYGGMTEDQSICVGNISVSESLPARVDINKLLTRHCALVGSTGSGKSNSVSVILSAIAKKNEYKSARVFVIDPHGEYNSSLKDDNQVFRINADVSKNEKELYIPFWALPFDELMKIFSGRVSDQQRDYIREKILELKLGSITHINPVPNQAAITADSPIPFSIKKLWFDLDDFERQTYTDMARSIQSNLVQTGNANELRSNIYQPASTTNTAPYLNNRAKGILNFLDSMRNRLVDNRYRFLFSPGEYEPTHLGEIVRDLNQLLSEWLGSNKKIAILDLSGVPTEIMASVSGAILKIIFDSLFWAQNLSVGGRKQPLLIVLEEAHNYLKTGVDSISSRTVQAIAKEGRKYGLGLLLVTQRPTELDETVLSQCGTVIALRMYNSSDRSHIASALQDDLNNITDLLPSLRTGEALIIGEAVKIPSRAKFFKMSESPKSSDPKVNEEWKKDQPDVTEYSRAVEYWRDQRFN